MPEPLQPPAPNDSELAHEIRNFLLALADNPDALVEYVRSPVRYFADNDTGLRDEAQSLLLDSNFERVHSVMKQSSTPARWLVIWLV
jgi:hypothetical protein